MRFKSLKKLLYLHKILLILICSTLCQLALSQNEKLEIDGAIIISNYEDQTPAEGTIRWTGQDFEGFDGTQWKSLTGCSTDPTGTCPDMRYVTHTILNTTQTLVKVKVETSHNMPLRMAYYPSSDPSQIQYGNCEATANYGASGSEHQQTTDGLMPSTEYTFIIQTSTDIGSNSADCATMNWEDISCPFSVTTLTSTTDMCMSFAQIRSAGRPENCYEEKNAGDYVDTHLAEFLWLNPTVANWTIDEATEVICAVPDPVPSNSAVLLPPPSGGDDSNMLENIINSNGSGEVVGQGTYLIGSTIDINVPIKIFNVPSKLINNVSVVWDVNVANVEFYNSIIDAQNLPSAHDGWRVLPGADNFVLTRSGIKNIYHVNRSTAVNAHGVLIQGGNDFRITCNKFNNLINDSDAMRAIRLTSNNLPQPRGDVANNECIDLQARPLAGDPTIDPEFFVSQGFTGSIGRVRVMANRCVDAGKRLTKWQHHDGFVASNFYHWRNPSDVWGNRQQKHVVNVQIDADRITAVNNRIKIEGGGRWGNLIEISPEYNDRTFRDIHFDCNDIELLEPPAATFYARGISLKNKDASSSDTRNQLINCSASGNVFRGSGGTNHIFAFDAGYDDDGSELDFDLSGNIVTTSILISVFRGSNATLP